MMVRSCALLLVIELAEKLPLGLATLTEGLPLGLATPTEGVARTRRGSG
jgi:hypothetical protein